MYYYLYLLTPEAEQHQRKLILSPLDRQYIGMAIALTLHVFASFASPVAINRILKYV